MGEGYQLSNEDGPGLTAAIFQVKLSQFAVPKHQHSADCIHHRRVTTRQRPTKTITTESGCDCINITKHAQGAHRGHTLGVALEGGSVRKLTLSALDFLPNLVTNRDQQTVIEVVPCEAAVLRFFKAVAWEEV